MRKLIMIITIGMLYTAKGQVITDSSTPNGLINVWDYYQNDNVFEGTSIKTMSYATKSGDDKLYLSHTLNSGNMGFYISIFDHSEAHMNAKTLGDTWKLSHRVITGVSFVFDGDIDTLVEFDVYTNYSHTKEDDVMLANNVRVLAFDDIITLRTLMNRHNEMDVKITSYLISNPDISGWEKTGEVEKNYFKVSLKNTSKLMNKFYN